MKGGKYLWERPFISISRGRWVIQRKYCRKGIYFSPFCVCISWNMHSPLIIKPPRNWEKVEEKGKNRVFVDFLTIKRGIYSSNSVSFYISVGDVFGKGIRCIFWKDNDLFFTIVNQNSFRWDSNLWLLHRATLPTGFQMVEKCGMKLICLRHIMLQQPATYNHCWRNLK